MRSGDLSEPDIVLMMNVKEAAMEHASTLKEKPYLEDLSTKDEKLLGRRVVINAFG